MGTGISPAWLQPRPRRTARALNGAAALPNGQTGHQDGQAAATGGHSGEIVCKLGWWDQVPWDVRAYAERHPLPV